jgi:hypothetical protein
MLRVSKLRSFYSVEANTERPLEYDKFQTLSTEDRDVRAAFKFESCIKEGIYKFYTRNRAPTRNRASTLMLFSSDVNSSGRGIEQVIACDRPRAIYNEVFGSQINLQMAIRKFQEAQATLSRWEREFMAQDADAENKTWSCNRW